MRELKKLLRIYNGFILPLIILVVSGGIVFWGIIPGVKAIQNMFIRNHELSKEVKLIEKRVNILESMDMPSLESYLNSLLSAVPHEKSIPTFLLSLEGLGQQTGIAVNNFAIDSPGSLASASAETATPTVSQNVIIADVSIAGNLEQLKTFFDTLPKVRRLMAVTDFSLSFPIDSEVMVSNISLRAFYAALPKTLGKPNDPIEALSDKDSEILAKISSYPSAIISQSQLIGQQNYPAREDPFSL